MMRHRRDGEPARATAGDGTVRRLLFMGIHRRDTGRLCASQADSCRRALLIPSRAAEVMPEVPPALP